MYTTMAFVALTLGNLSGTTSWQNDYQTAMQRVSVSGKPMVVFVGQAGPQSVIREGAFSPEVSKLLTDKFVCLYVDTNKPAGKSLAQAFQVNKGVVISDRTGTTQAFSLAGEVSAAELSATLVAYADPKDVKKTETVVKDPKAVVVVAAPAATCGAGGCCNKGYSSGCGTTSSGCCGWSFCNKGASGCGTTTTSSGCCGKSWGGCCGWGWGGGCGKSYSSGCGGSGCGNSYSSGCSTGVCNK